MRIVGTFVRELFKEWWGLMSCAAFTFLGLYIAAASKNNTWVVAGVAVLGLILFFVAAFRTWKRQYDARVNAESELNKEADIQGTITLVADAFSPYADHRSASTVRIDCDCANYGKRGCEIGKFEVILPESDLLKAQTCTLRPPVIVGPEQALRFYGTYLVNDIAPEQLAEMSPRIVLIDSVGRRYEKPVTKFVRSVPVGTM